MKVVWAVFYLVLGSFGFCFPAQVQAGTKFDRLLEVFNAADAVAPDDIPSEMAWAGFCTENDDSMDDALVAMRHAQDPALGRSLKILQRRTVGSSQFYLRMSPEEVRRELDFIDPSQWTDGHWESADGYGGAGAQDLFLDKSERFSVAMRRVKSDGAPGFYFITLKKCQSQDGRNCGRVGGFSALNFQICHYYLKKI